MVAMMAPILAEVDILKSQPGWVSIITIVILLFLALTMMAYMTYYERKLIAYMQDRVGPTRTGFRGLLQPAADGVKLLFKEDIIPRGADRWVFFFAPIVVFVCALTSLCCSRLVGSGAFRSRRGGTSISSSPTRMSARS